MTNIKKSDQKSFLLFLFRLSFGLLGTVGGVLVLGCMVLLVIIFSISYRDFPIKKVLHINSFSPYDSEGYPTGMVSKEWILNRPEAHLFPPNTTITFGPDAIGERYDPGDIIENPPMERAAEVDYAYESTLSGDQIIAWYRNYFISRGGWHEVAPVVDEVRADLFHYKRSDFFVGIAKPTSGENTTKFHTRYYVKPYTDDKPNAVALLCSDINFNKIRHTCTEYEWVGTNKILPTAHLTISDFNKKEPHTVTVTAYDSSKSYLKAVTATYNLSAAEDALDIPLINILPRDSNKSPIPYPSGFSTIYFNITIDGNMYPGKREIVGHIE